MFNNRHNMTHWRRFMTLGVELAPSIGVFMNGPTNFFSQLLPIFCCLFVLRVCARVIVCFVFVLNHRIRAGNRDLFWTVIKVGEKRDRLKLCKQADSTICSPLRCLLAFFSVLMHFISCRGLGKLWEHQRPPSTHVGHTVLSWEWTSDGHFLSV